MRSGRLDSCKAVALTVKTYHSRNQAAAGQLRFFSGDLRASSESGITPLCGKQKNREQNG